MTVPAEEIDAPRVPVRTNRAAFGDLCQRSGERFYSMLK